MPHGLHRLFPAASAYAAAVLVGYLAFRIRVPLAWMLGPMITAACISIMVRPLDPNVHLRRLGQIGIGVAVGMNLTAPVVVGLVGWLPLMVISAFFSVLVCCVSAALLMRYAALDTKTAFFASLPGGLAEMANIGARVGARSEAIAVVQTLRVAVVVMILPPILILLESDLAALPQANDVVPLVWVPLLIVGGICGAALFGLLGLNNPFMVGAVIFTGFVVSSGLISGSMPSWAFFGAQLLLGFAIGARFRREMLTDVPRLSLCGVVSALSLSGIMALYAVAISPFGDLGLEGALLATSPGGLSEVAATAQMLHLAVPTIVGFQVVRGILVNAFASHYYTLLTRIGLLGFLERTLVKQPPPRP